MNVRRANLSKKPDTVTLDCLALPSSDGVPEVEVVYEEGTMRTDFDRSESLQSILQVLGLDQDPEHHGCREFYLTIHAGPLPAERGRSVLQPWVERLSLRHQGVLMACVRGCDNVPKEDATKALARCLRAVTLVSFDRNPSSFIENVGDTELRDRMMAVLKNHDHYPIHYIMHLMHGAEIVGYKHPDPHTRDCWRWFYTNLVRCLHLLPETEYDLDERLGACEAKFAEAAKPGSAYMPAVTPRSVPIPPSAQAVRAVKSPYAL